MANKGLQPGGANGLEGGEPLSTRREFADGMRASLAITAAASPFGALFGAAAVAEGWSATEALFASFAIYAGASQFVALEVNGLGVPAWSVLLAVFAVNFRHILYSASLGRKMVHFSGIQKVFAFFLMTDPQWAVSEARHESHGLRPAFYFGYGLTIYTAWCLASTVGVIFGSIIESPERFGLDMLLPVYFLVLLMGFRARPRWLPIVLISGVTAAILFVTIGPPWHISLGALTGIAVAALLPLEPTQSEAAERLAAAQAEAPDETGEPEQQGGGRP